MQRFIFLTIVLGLSSKLAFADRFRDHDSLIGAKAASLGGAYTALSDDASGIYYNPGGIAFSRGQGVSLSSSSLETQRTVYKNALGNQDLKVTSGGFESNFIGSTFSLSSMGLQNWYGAAGIYSNGSSATNQELNGSNNRIDEVVLDKTYVAIKLENKNTIYSAALSTMVSENLSFGFSLGLNSDTALRQQFVYLCLREPEAEGPIKDIKACTNSNRVEKDEQITLLFSFGSRWQINSFTSLGLSLAGGKGLSHKRTSTKLFSLNYVKPDDTYASAEELGRKEPNKYQFVEQESSEDFGRENQPLSGRLGVASLFLGSSLLLTADLMYFHKIGKNKSTAQRNSKLNVATGARYNLDSKKAMSAGFFTNYDFRATTDTFPGNEEKIDFQGGNLTFSYLFGSTVGYLTALTQHGKGKAIPVQTGGNNPLRPVTSRKQVLLLGLESQLN